MMFEIEELIKSINRSGIKAVLRHAAIINDPASSEEMKAQALENVRAIAHIGKLEINTSAPKKNKPVVAQPAEAIRPVQPPIQASPARQSPQIQQTIAPPGAEFHEQFAQYHKMDPATFKQIWHKMTPEQQQTTQDWHAEQLAAPKIQKNIEQLYNLFMQLKKRL